ncbi:hypothetical protein [Streptomyces chartreusis]|uniref:hypothetical protein n=1 Tax=Streptomyces chartreusis TaxID=1969 RepID=UPI0033B98C8E
MVELGADDVVGLEMFDRAVSVTTSREFRSAPSGHAGEAAGMAAAGPGPAATVR